MKPTLSRPLQRRIMERLDRLQESLASLGERLREGIAQVVSAHAADAVRDAVRSALGRPAPAQPPARLYHGDPDPDHPYAGHYDDRDDDRPAGMWDASRRQPVRPSTSQRPPSSWWLLVPALVRVAARMLNAGPTRRPVLTAVGLGATAGLVALAAGPVVGALVAAAGAALSLVALADGLRDAAAGLASAGGEHP